MHRFEWMIPWVCYGVGFPLMAFSLLIAISPSSIGLTQNDQGGWTFGDEPPIPTALTTSYHADGTVVGGYQPYTEDEDGNMVFGDDLSVVEVVNSDYKQIYRTVTAEEILDYEAGVRDGASEDGTSAEDNENAKAVLFGPQPILDSEASPEDIVPGELTFGPDVNLWIGTTTPELREYWGLGEGGVLHVYIDGVPCGEGV